MRTATIVLGVMALGVLLVGGCKENPVEEYGDTLIKSMERSEKTAGAANVSLLQNVVKTFRAANGRYPADLAEIEQTAGVPVDPALYEYDPATGVISLK